MLEDRIIVQDRGIDAGLAALMQNANKGSVTQVSSIYDAPLPPGQFPMPNQPRKKVVDITI